MKMFHVRMRSYDHVEAFFYRIREFLQANVSHILSDFCQLTEAVHQTHLVILP